MLVALRRLAFQALIAGLLLPAVSFAQESQPAAKAPVGLDPATLESLVKSLSAENRRKLGEMLEADWKDRPEWADMLIQLLQEKEMRPPFGWFQPSVQKFDYTWLAAKFDANSDGLIDKSELPQDTPNLDQVFSRLDRDADGQLQRSDFDYAGGQPATMPQAISQSLFSLLDRDTNGRISQEELNEFFSRADKDKTGFLIAEDLHLEFAKELSSRTSGGDGPSSEQMLAMFFRGELGLWEPGPRLGEEAPDFTLPTHDGRRTVTLSQCRGKPVILIFGSFT
jgi:Ca2+-binding EF-hand superfamily protein